MKEDLSIPLPPTSARLKSVVDLLDKAGQKAQANLLVGLVHEVEAMELERVHLRKQAEALGLAPLWDAACIGKIVSVSPFLALIQSAASPEV